MNIWELIIGIVLLAISIGYGIFRIAKTPTGQNFSTKATIRLILLTSLGTVGGIALIVFAFL